MWKRKHRLGPRCRSRLHREASPSLRSKLSALPSVRIGARSGVLERWRRKERTSGGVCEGGQDLLSFQRPGRQNGRRVRINKQTATKGRRISDEALLRCRRACLRTNAHRIGNVPPRREVTTRVEKCQASHCLESDRSSNGL